MPSPPESGLPTTLLLREVPAHAGTAGTELLAPALAGALRETPAARCRMYVLADLAGPAAAPPAAAVLVETESAARRARLRALAVAPPYRRRGFGRRLLADLLTELRADGVRRVHYREDAEDCGVSALLRSAGFTCEEGGPGGPRQPGAPNPHELRETGGLEVTYQYDEAETGPLAIVWLVREL
ncbi:GNAT family N-acetyltransferase [Planomonospora venezuelensis]|uniref:GNAT superfamily N-acetyltransferase n=1 Tax=Planomonospora venezuelensis TaxID=1999 RepID=A0A841DEQ1_PLAVE|nr:GNAT family N-acetyltransferase [Planomonospora venezuelensis]MBB5965756.1 GNAT superfamily N-acetyltransferase [Planomonospora venezuelensis]GIN04410.1 hypothetical protein Pve01_60680 [Planomonospora venezuelensis]